MVAKNWHSCFRLDKKVKKKKTLMDNGLDDRIVYENAALRALYFTHIALRDRLMTT